MRQQHESEEDVVLSLDAFVRSVGIKRSVPLSVFVGAGASVSSGLPSAQTCIWEWKRNIFLTNNPGLEEQFTELSLSGVRRRIQQWLDGQGRFPSDGASDEYGFYIQECFPITEDRRGYFQDKVRKARPHVGYRLLCHLAEADLVRSVWSTNFDSLVARAAASFNLTPREVGIDSQQRLVSPPGQGELLCVSLHGDYRYDALKNTPEELQTQEAEFCKALIEQTRTTPMIVIGYSGRDQSVMNALHSAYTGPGTGTLFWCGFSDSLPPEHVAALIQHARRNGRRAYYVSTVEFDDLMTRLALHCLHGDRREAARRSIEALAPEDLLHREAFSVPPITNPTLIKGNSFEIECPAEVFQFDLKVWPVERVWERLRETAGDRQLVAVPMHGKVLAFGTIEDIHDAFGTNIKGKIHRTPVVPEDFRRDNGIVVSLMRQALVRSMAESAGVETDGYMTLWLHSACDQVHRGRDTYSVHEAVVIYLRRIGGVQHLVLKPSFKVFDQSGVDPPKEIANSIKLPKLGYQHNKPFNKAVNKWREKLFPKGRGAAMFSFPPGSAFSFRVRRLPIFASIGVPLPGRSLQVPANMEPLIKHRGMQLAEPPLLFSNKAGTAPIKDTHPIRGIVNNRPYDYPLISRGLLSSLRIGVVCPQAEAKYLYSALQYIHQTLTPYSTDQDYLLNYPGFQEAYGIPVELPEPDSAGWITCSEPSARDAVQGVRDAASLIVRNIETLQASYNPDVVLIYVPDRWQAYRSYNTETESFDLHNFVKAFCVQKGIATQFLNQDTLSDKIQRCRIWWWLSLALYVKGMRTPWVLDNCANDTAFVGLGYSIDRKAQDGSHIVLGCSHIYSARGEGLQYRLSKIENPIIRRHNPFMSADDARRFGGAIRQLFFDAHMKLPERVVLHKHTPFIKEEREGIREGLGGVKYIDMLEIQMDRALRYVASVQKPDGKYDDDNFPVRRGTVMKLDDYSALLWVHGATAALHPSRKYFQGKRRIPAPLIVRRHAGRTPLVELASEILGLSKMNWNNFDLYTKLPATLESSGEIARIGSLLQRFGTLSYDYRLFI